MFCIREIGKICLQGYFKQVFGCECLDAIYFHCGAQGSAEVYAEEALRKELHTLFFWTCPVQIPRDRGRSLYRGFESRRVPTTVGISPVVWFLPAGQAKRAQLCRRRKSNSAERRQ